MSVQHCWTVKHGGMTKFLSSEEEAALERRRLIDRGIKPQRITIQYLPEWPTHDPPMTADKIMAAWRRLQAECVEVTFESDFLPWDGVVVCRIHNDQLANDFVEARDKDPQVAFERAYKAYKDTPQGGRV